MFYVYYFLFCNTKNLPPVVFKMETSHNSNLFVRNARDGSPSTILPIPSVRITIEYNQPSFEILLQHFVHAQNHQTSTTYPFSSCLRDTIVCTFPYSSNLVLCGTTKTPSSPPPDIFNTYTNCQNILLTFSKSIYFCTPTPYFCNKVL